jgi:hypothetical protein
MPISGSEDVPMVNDAAESAEGASANPATDSPQSRRDFNMENMANPRVSIRPVSPPRRSTDCWNAYLSPVGNRRFYLEGAVGFARNVSVKPGLACP